MDEYRTLFIVFMGSIAVLTVVALVFLIFFKSDPLYRMTDSFGDFFK